MAQTKKVTVELGFKANTEAVKKNINELTANLKQISNMQIGLKGSDLDQAKKAAKELTLELQKAVNVDTGRLDLNKLTANLKKGHKDIVGLSSELLKAGPIGQKSFLQIAQAMSQAEVPMVKINQSLKDFMDNLGKTAKWQIAQMAIQGVQSSIQNAVREAEQLNRALNDIRIVTGYDKTVMAQFAKEANKAAKELKTTTKEYAEASLIFYQQGLSQAEVAKRAETVIKMSQVTGDTAKAVSDQMTAIWNNFADGTKSLEYYADAMARLGAITAANTSEIANGLEKFAAIAETVGLSYETAMASVATVIDKTRQSADVVGTAFKTIFARIQGLGMDGVTDDGVTLNKYSAALEKVGVEVLTASGELRDMDEILNDLGAKWQLLGRESQVAVAQVVGGARQYNQLLSLMDNWSEVQSNILEAEGSTGEIAKQANIWAESYEAASKRVEEAKARAAENFLNSEDVVNLTNAFADLITWVDKFIDSFGGVIPLALAITGVFSGKLIPIAKTGFTSLTENFKTFMGGAMGASQKLIETTQNQFNEFLESYKGGQIEDSLKVQFSWNQKLIKVKQDMAKITKYMSEQEKQNALTTLAVYEESIQAAIKAGQALNDAQIDVKQTKAKIKLGEVQKSSSAQFFKDKKISDEAVQGEIRTFANDKYLQSKLNLANNAEQIEEDRKTQLDLLESKKDEREKTRKIIEENDSRARQAQKRLEKLPESEENAEAIAREKRIIQESIEARDAARKDIGIQTQDIKKEEEIYAKLEEDSALAQEYSKKKSLLETAKQYQDSKQHVTTRDGIVEASFGSTALQADKDLTLSDQQRVLYDRQIKQEKQYSEDSSLNLDLDDRGNVKNSIQNYETLREKITACKIQLEGIADINEQIVDSEKEINQIQSEINNITKEQEQLTRKENYYSEYITELRGDYRTLQNRLDTGDFSSEEEKAQIESKLLETEQLYTTAMEQFNKVSDQNSKLHYKKEALVEKLTKAEQKALKTTENNIKVLQKNKKELLAFAKTAGLTEEELKDLEKQIDGLEDASGVDKIKKQFKDLEAVTGHTVNTMEVVSETMAQALSENIDPKIIEELAQKYDIAEEKALELARAMKQGQESSKEFEDSISKFGNKFESVASGIGQASAAIGGMYAGVNQLIDAFDSGNTPMETFLGVLGGVVAIAPAVAMAFKAISAANSAYSKKKIADNAKEAGSEAATAGVTVTAQVAKHLASLNPAGIAAAVAAAALLATIGIGAAVANSAANKKEQQRERNTASIEAAEKSNEIASATKTESQAIDELIGQYNQLNAAQEDTTAIKEDIINQTDKAIEKYKEYADSIHVAAGAQIELKNAIQELEDAKALGDIEGIKRAQEKADLLIAKTAKEQNDLGTAGILGNIGLKEDAKQVKAKDGYVQRQVGGAGAEEVEANSILQKAMGESVVATRNRGTRIKLRTDSAEHFVEDYGKLQTAVDNMLKSSDSRVKDPNINDTLRECQELLSTYQEEYNSLKSQIATGAAYNAQIAIGNVAKTGHSVSNINKYTDYTKYKQTVQDEINSSDLTDEEKSAALESLDSQLSANSELKKYTDLEKKLDIIAAKGTDARNRLEELLDGVDIEAALNVDYSVYSNEEDVVDEIARQTNEIERKAAQKNIKAYSEIGELLKPEGMTEEDWTKIAESDLFKGDPEAFQSFMNQSYGSQISQLSKDNRAQIQTDIDLLKENIESYKETLKTTKSAEAWDAAKASLEAAQQELAIKLKVQEAQENYIKTLRASDIVDIYHDINKSLTELERQYKKIQQIQDDTFGDSAISLYDDLIDNIDKQNEKIKDRIDLNSEEAIFKRNQFVQKHQDNFDGMEFEFDSDGNLLNYNELAESLLARGRDGEDIEVLLEEWKNDYAEYSEYVDEIYNDLDKIEENERYKKELNFKKITATVDLTIEINDMKLKKYEYEINKSLKDISTSADALDIYGNQLADITTLTGQYSTQVQELERAYQAGEITEADYVAGLQETYDQTFNNLQVLEELKQAIMNFYGEQLSKAAEEIDKYTSKMESATSVLDHYQTLLGLINESSGESMRAVVNAQLATSKDIFEASKNEYAFYKEQADGARAELANFTGDTNSDAYKELENRVEAAEEKEKESLDRMYSNAADWAENIRAKVEFELSEAAKTVEKNYLESFKDIEGNIQFSSYEEVLTAMERKSLLQEDFLTSTNKTYELNKMINQLERDALKTDNVRAKQKLESFKTELKNLQQSGKLSKAELDIKQREYELTLAEIALEEAQNAKSVVRLTRTADGGFGYVYTADENATAEAEQNKADAENALYNAKLEVQNNYTQKTIQAQSQFHQEMQDLTQRYINGEIASEEEFQRQKEALWSYYSQLIGDYSGILSSDLVHDSLVAKDAWSKDFQDMALDMDGWTTSITGEEGYFAKINGALSTWASDLSEFKSTVGLEFTDISTNVGNIATKVGELTTALGNKDSGVIKGLQGFMAEVSTWLTGNAGTFLSNIGNLATTFGQLATKILEAVNAAKAADNIETYAEGVGNVTDGYYDTWEKTYNAVMNGEKVEFKEDYEYSKEYNDGAKNAFKDAIALATAHKQAKTTYATASDIDSQIASSFEEAKALVDSGNRATTNFAYKSNTTNNNTGDEDTGGGDTESTRPATWKDILSSWKSGNSEELRTKLDTMLDKANADKVYSLLTAQGRSYDNSKYMREYIGSLGDKGGSALSIEKLQGEKQVDDILSRTGVFYDALRYLEDYNQGLQWNIIDLISQGQEAQAKEVFKAQAPLELMTSLAWLASNGTWTPSVIEGTNGTQYKKNKISINDMSFYEWKEPWAYFTGPDKYKYRISRNQIMGQVGFDTGGYTGSWGPEGKMAMLHEKEIVLNKEDTVNLLDSIKLLRSILTTIDLQAANAQFSSLLSSSYFAPSTTGETLEQNVHIDAHFDNVTDRNEIVEAFNTLINRASQYANRKR